MELGQDDWAQRFAERWADAWNSHDLDAVMALYSPDPRHRMSSGPWRDGSEVRAMVQRSLVAYRDLSFSIRDAVAVDRDSGRKIIVEYTMRGTQSGSINGREGSIRPIAVDGALAAVCDDLGRMVVVVDYIDHQAIRLQQGISN